MIETDGAVSNGKSEHLTEAGKSVFIALGYHRATVEDVLKEAGVSRSTFYIYFRNKRELFTAVVNRVMDDIISAIGEGVDGIIAELEASPGDTPERAELEGSLSGLMSSVLRYIEAHRGMARVFLNELVGIDEAMTGVFHEFERRLVAQFERLIAFGIEHEVVRDVCARRAAEFVVGGLIYLARNISSGAVEYDIDAVSREFVEIQMRGLGSEEVAV